jgi:hypothetical protein
MLGISKNVRNSSMARFGAGNRERARRSSPVPDSRFNRCIFVRISKRIIVYFDTMPVS